MGHAKCENSSPPFDRELGVGPPLALGVSGTRQNEPGLRARISRLILKATNRRPVSPLSCKPVEKLHHQSHIARNFDLAAHKSLDGIELILV